MWCVLNDNEQLCFMYQRSADRNNRMQNAYGRLQLLLAGL